MSSKPKSASSAENIDPPSRPGEQITDGVVILCPVQPVHGRAPRVRIAAAAASNAASRLEATEA